MWKNECFKIRIMKAQTDPFDIKSMIPIREINFDRPSLKFDPITIVADPFLFVYKDFLYLFYEKKTLRNKGILLMEKTEDLCHWSDPVVVLDEDFHLSYPWVFSENGHVYMIPETSENKSIRLYEASDDSLSCFKLKKVLLTDEDTAEKEFSFSDSSIIRSDKNYYLLTSYRNKDAINVAELYYANDLFGPYIKHESSPICISNKYARNAGAMLEIDGVKYRFAQDCEQKYGDNVHILRISDISKTDYSEEAILDDIIPTNLAYYKAGGHQYNSVIYKNMRIVATDAKEYHSYLLNRIARKIFGGLSGSKNG